MFHHLKHAPHESCDDCSDWPLWWADLAIRIYEGNTHIMADLTALSAAVDAQTAAVAALTETDASVVAALDDLSAKLADGGTVVQADIDAITAKVTASADAANQAIADMNAAVAKDDPPAPVSE